MESKCTIKEGGLKLLVKPMECKAHKPKSNISAQAISSGFGIFGLPRVDTRKAEANRHKVGSVKPTLRPFILCFHVCVRDHSPMAVPEGTVVPSEVTIIKAYI